MCVWGGGAVVEGGGGGCCHRRCENIMSFIFSAHAIFDDPVKVIW